MELLGLNYLLKQITILNKNGFNFSQIKKEKFYQLI